MLRLKLFRLACFAIHVSHQLAATHTVAQRERGVKFTWWATVACNVNRSGCTRVRVLDYTVTVLRSSMSLIGWQLLCIGTKNPYDPLNNRCFTE